MEYKGHWITDKKVAKVFTGEPCFETYIEEGIAETTKQLPIDFLKSLNEGIKEIEWKCYNSQDAEPRLYFKVKQTYNSTAGMYTLQYIPCYSRLETDEEQAKRIANDKKYWDNYEEAKLKADNLIKEKEIEEENKKVEEAKELLKSKGYTILGN